MNSQKDNNNKSVNEKIPEEVIRAFYEQDQKEEEERKMEDEIIEYKINEVLKTDSKPLPEENISILKDFPPRTIKKIKKIVDIIDELIFYQSELPETEPMKLKINLKEFLKEGIALNSIKKILMILDLYNFIPRYNINNQYIEFQPFWSHYVDLNTNENFKKLKSALKHNNKKNTKEYKGVSIKDKIPKDANWKNIEIRFINKLEIKIFCKGKKIGRYNNEKLGCFKKNMSHKTDNTDTQWRFLQTLSTNKGKFDLGKYINKPKEKEKFKGRKKRLIKNLKHFFGLKEDPILYKEEDKSYHTKFKIEPEPDLRGDGELYQPQKNTSL